MYNPNQYNNFEYNECVAKGICSISPSVAALQEIILQILRQTAYYLLMLKNFEVDTLEYDYTILCMLSSSLSGSAYGDDKLLGIVSTSDLYLKRIKRLYMGKCETLNIKPVELKQYIKITPNMNLSQIISAGELYIKKTYEKLSPQKKYSIELFNLILKNTSLNLVQLLEYEQKQNDFTNKILYALSSVGNRRFSLNFYHKEITKLAELNHEILVKLSKLTTKTFGNIHKKEVSLSSSTGKAILVSGKSLTDLKNLLESLKETDIDVYTHDDLLNAHMYETFSKYKNLKAHYGNCSENCLLDFATFPGAILLTKFFSMNLDYLYRGRLFTTAKILPKGVVKIENTDFTPIINSACEAKGFAKGQQRKSVIVGFDKEKLIELLSDINKTLQMTEERKILTVYPSNNTVDISSMDINIYDYIISFSKLDGIISNRSILELNIASDYSILHNILELIFSNISPYTNKFVFYFPKISSPILSDIIYLNNYGIKELYITENSTNGINPGVLNFIRKVYNLINI